MSPRIQHESVFALFVALSFDPVASTGVKVADQSNSVRTATVKAVSLAKASPKDLNAGVAAARP